jgi:hypothetical protein
MAPDNALSQQEAALRAIEASQRRYGQRSVEARLAQQALAEWTARAMEGDQAVQGTPCHGRE